MDTKDFYREIGRRITEARLAKGISQEEAAKLLEVTRVTWNHTEKGTQKITIDRLISISKILEVPLQKLVPGLSEETQMDISSEGKFNEEEKNEILNRLEEIKKGATE
jgi:transcriptional regulator with XRE-family HTH domain